MPPISLVRQPIGVEFGVAAEGHERAWTDNEPSHELPVFDSLRKKAHYIDVFPRNDGPANFTIKADQPWIILREGKAFSVSPEDRRFWVEIDWSKAPVGESRGVITVTGDDRNPDVLRVQTVQVRALRATPEQEREAQGTFAALAGPIAFNADAAMRNIAVGDVHWEKLPDYGREESAMTIFPVTAASIKQGADAPRLEYDVYFAHAGAYHVDLITNPTSNMYPGRGLAIEAAIDADRSSGWMPSRHLIGQQTALASRGRSEWAERLHPVPQVNARLMQFTVNIDKPGKHTLQLSMVDPTIVLEKIVVHDEQLPSSLDRPQSLPTRNKQVHVPPTLRSTRAAKKLTPSASSRRIYNRRQSGNIMKFTAIFRGLIMLFNSARALAASAIALLVLSSSTMVWSQASAHTASAPVVGKSLRYCNPLPLETSSHDGSPQGVNLGDVTVVRDGDSYYLFGTGGGAWVSRDFVDWKYQAVEVHGGRLPVAPHVVKYNGAFYMSGNDAPLYKAANILGPYELLGPWKNEKGEPWTDHLQRQNSSRRF